MATKRKLLFIADPGHGWLKVNFRDLVALGIAGQVSHYSYLNNGYAYLEEDCDAGLFVRAAKAAGWEIKYDDEYQDPTPIRNYPSYPTNLMAVL